MVKPIWNVHLNVMIGLTANVLTLFNYPRDQGPILLEWVNFNHNTYNYLYPLCSVRII